MPILNIKISSDDDSATQITGAAASVDERWVALNGSFEGSVNLQSGHHWLAWLVSGPSGTKFTVTGWAADPANPIFKEKREIAANRPFQQGNRGFIL